MGLSPRSTLSPRNALGQVSTHNNIFGGSTISPRTLITPRELFPAQDDGAAKDPLAISAQSPLAAAFDAGDADLLVASPGKLSSPTKQTGRFEYSMQVATDPDSAVSAMALIDAASPATTSAPTILGDSIVGKADESKSTKDAETKDDSKTAGTQKSRFVLRFEAKLIWPRQIEDTNRWFVLSCDTVDNSISVWEPRVGMVR
jgi:hypothetical protein